MKTVPMLRLCQNLVLFVLCAAAPSASIANDSSYYMSGNQLIPTVETEISISHERLTVTRNGGQMDVLVEYEFFNPGPARTLIVGFEAMAPQGDADTEPVDGEHPYMRDFTVVMNGNDLGYDVALTQSDIEVPGPDAITVTEHIFSYYFDAPFKPGKNTITHTYSFDLSGSVFERYNFEYVLTAANRWAGDGIGSFELYVDMGALTEFNIRPTFFNGAEDWTILGTGRGYDVPEYYNFYKEYQFDLSGPMFGMQDGAIRFTRKNFRPAGELFIWVPSVSVVSGITPDNVNEDPRFDASRDLLPLNITHSSPFRPEDEFSQRVLENYLFARRGYVFKTPELQAYFERQPWYIPDPSYKANPDEFSESEQAWRERLTELTAP